MQYKIVNIIYIIKQYKPEASGTVFPTGSVWRKSEGCDLALLALFDMDDSIRMEGVEGVVVGFLVPALREDIFYFSALMASKAMTIATN